ncbi:eukaryotic polypeptide chain release factor 3 [Peniophora sp. CONT]|nr:eukaryotic polypeptide chain release factor 3 [Peniophora sp. CONT]
MSKLNAGAFEFVPRTVRPAQPPPSQPPAFVRQEESAPSAPAPTFSLNIGGSKPSPAPAPAPAPPAFVRRDEPADAPAPAPTISLSIGGSKPAAPPPAAAAKPTPPPPAAAAPSLDSVPENKVSKKEAASTSKTFTMDRAKTDTAAIAQEVKDVADQAVLEDLYGHVKEHLNIVFIGHVDAGKSTMGGNLLFLTGMVDKRTMEKYEKEAKEAGRESWYLSWALDSTTQERAKGKTVEVGRAYFETDRRRYTILDAPGHKTYVPSMISGAAQADVAVLVISARKGEFETGFEKGGQTREHITLAKTAGVTKIIVVINKMDDSTVNWQKSRYDEIVGKLQPFLKGSSFNLKTDVTFLAVSAYTGANIKDRVSKAVCPWWEGPSLLEFLDSLPVVGRNISAPLMMPISEKYKDLGTVAVGKIESGAMRKGDSLLLMPNRQTVEVAGISNELDEEVTAAFSGDNIRVKLRGVEDEEISPGFVLSSAAKPVKSVRTFEAQLAILEHKNIICAGYSAVMHVHTLAEEVTLSALLHYFDKSTGRKSRKPPQFAKRGQRIVALVETSQPVCVERFVDYPQLGRFTLRDEGKTVAIGKVTKLIESVDDLSEGVQAMALAGTGN